MRLGSVAKRLRCVSGKLCAQSCVSCVHCVPEHALATPLQIFPIHLLPRPVIGAHEALHKRRAAPMAQRKAFGLAAIFVRNPRIRADKLVTSAQSGRAAQSLHTRSTLSCESRAVNQHPAVKMLSRRPRNSTMLSTKTGLTSHATPAYARERLTACSALRIPCCADCPPRPCHHPACCPPPPARAPPSGARTRGRQLRPAAAARQRFRTAGSSGPVSMSEVSKARAQTTTAMLAASHPVLSTAYPPQPRSAGVPGRPRPADAAPPLQQCPTTRPPSSGTCSLSWNGSCVESYASSASAWCGMARRRCAMRMLSLSASGDTKSTAVCGGARQRGR
jgi:hypothetical protein